MSIVFTSSFTNKAYLHITIITRTFNIHKYRLNYVSKMSMTTANLRSPTCVENNNKVIKFTCVFNLTLVSNVFCQHRGPGFNY